MNSMHLSGMIDLEYLSPADMLNINHEYNRKRAQMHDCSSSSSSSFRNEASIKILRSDQLFASDESSEKVHMSFRNIHG